MALPERVIEAKEAIKNHLKVVGSKDWEEVQKDFPDVSDASFWRYAKAVKADLKHEVALASNPDLFTQNKVEASTEQDPWEQQRPNALFRGLKQAQRFQALYADALALRDHAVHGESRIKNPVLFAKSIRIREQLLNAEMSVLDGIHSADAATAFLEKVVNAVAQAAPETAREIMDSLYELQKSQEAKDKKV